MVSQKPATTSSPVLDAVVRVSRVNGRDGESFMSPDVQRDTILAWAARSGVTVDQWHEELDVSGKTTDREGLRAAADRAISGEVDGIVVARVNRFARNLLSGLTTLHELNVTGRRLVFVEENIDTGTRMNAAAKLMLNMLLSVAQWQLDSLTEQWRTIDERVIRRGVSRNEPFGYRRGDGKRLVPVPDEAETIREIFRGRADGKSWSELADVLNRAGHKPRRGERFVFSRAKDIVRNDVYLGVLRSGALVNRNAHEPIIDRALWEAANGHRGSTARSDATMFLLAGLVRCPGCGVRMSGMTDRKTLADGTTKEYRYYRCRRSHTFGRCQAPAKFRADDIEAAAQAAFHDLYLARRETVSEPITGDELAEAAAELTDAETALSNFVRVASSLDAALFEAGLSIRQATVSSARERYSAAERAETGLTLPPDLATMWVDLSVEDRRGFLSDGLAAVTVVDGHLVVWAVNDPALPALPGIGGHAAITPLNVPGRSRVKTR
jgi:DNA invertase Pin-like site-specific DNA recombinase